MTDYVVTARGNLIGDDFLNRLWAAKFVIKMFSDGQNSQAGIEDETGLGRVPETLDLWRFANRQDRYSKELKLRTPVLKRSGKKRK